MSDFRSNATAGDRLRITIVEECTKSCPARRAAKGDIGVTAIRAGDMVNIKGLADVVLEVTTEPGGNTGSHTICGRRRRLAAASLILESGTTVLVDSTVEKICPECGRTGTRFR